MEFTLGSYKNKLGNVYTTENGHNIRSIIFHEKCPCTAKLNKLTDIITISCEHSAEDIPLKSCESIMYRAPRETQPKIPKSALEFSTVINDCLPFNQYFKENVVVGTVVVP